MLPRPQALGFIVYSAIREVRNRWLKKESVGRCPLVFAPASCEKKRSLFFQRVLEFSPLSRGFSRPRRAGARSSSGTGRLFCFWKLRVGELLLLGVVGSLLQKCRGLCVEEK
jgi:hypothetical protein